MKEKNYLILKLIILIASGILYWFFDDGFSFDLIFDSSTKFEVHSEKKSAPENYNAELKKLVDAQEKKIVELENKINGSKISAANSSDQNNLALQKFNEGFAAFERGDYSTAISFYTQAIELKPDYFEAYHNIGVAYVRRNDFNNALPNLNAAIKINPNSPKLYAVRGCIYLNLKNYSAAVSDCNKALQLEPQNADAFLFRALAQGNLKNFSQAISDCNSAMQLSEKLSANYLAIAYHTRGICYKELGENKKAQADIAKAKELGYSPNN